MWSIIVANSSFRFIQGFFWLTFGNHSFAAPPLTENTIPYMQSTALLPSNCASLGLETSFQTNKLDHSEYDFYTNVSQDQNVISH